MCFLLKKTIYFLMALTIMLMSCKEILNNPKDTSSNNNFKILIQLAVNNKWVLGVCDDDGTNFQILNDTSNVIGKQIIINAIGSPDGKHILYYKSDDKKRKLILTDQIGSFNKEVIDFVPDDEEIPAWSEDSKYFAMNPASGYYFSVFDSSGNKIQNIQLDSVNYVSDWLSWSPKENLIAVRLNDSSILISKPDGTWKFKTPIKSDRISWSDDGSKLNYIAKELNDSISIMEYSVINNSISHILSIEINGNYKLANAFTSSNQLYIINGNQIIYIDLNDNTTKIIQFQNNIRLLNYNSKNNKFIYIEEKNPNVHIYDITSQVDKIIATNCFQASWIMKINK
jgi:Tol biopolymer transport system component